MIRNNTNKALILLALLLIAAFAHATLLASATVDKTTIGENEVAFLTVKIMNDSQNEIKNANLRVSADEGMVFYSGADETTIFFQTIDSIKQNEVKEIIVKIKANAIKNPTANIYAYYGTGSELKQAAVTVIGTEPAAAVITATQQTQTINGNETATIDFSLKNNSTRPIYKASAEALAPKDFTVLTPPVAEEKILPGGIMAQKFNIKVPLEASGDQKIMVAYGYFDDTNSPHYFEKTFTFNVQRINYALIGVIGIIVLIIAGYLFLRKGNKKEVKGTSQKEETEKWKGHKK